VGNIDPDPGATNEITAANEVLITFETTVLAGIDQSENQSQAYWDENGDGALTALDNNIQSGTPVVSDDPGTAVVSDPTVATIPASLLPSTGFRPREITKLAPQPMDIAYAQSSLVLSIPSLNIKLPIVGVPYRNGNWNTTWLGTQAGYLEGSAYPTLPGNTVLTAHVWDSYNQPGPFSELTRLVYGDIILIEIGDTLHLYQVQSSKLISPDQTQEVFQHKDLDWISLVTCETWNDDLQQYSGRRLVRAILISTIKK